MKTISKIFIIFILTIYSTFVFSDFTYNTNTTAGNCGGDGTVYDSPSSALAAGTECVLQYIPREGTTRYVRHSGGPTLGFGFTVESSYTTPLYYYGGFVEFITGWQPGVVQNDSGPVPFTPSGIQIIGRYDSKSEKARGESCSLSDNPINILTGNKYKTSLDYSGMSPSLLKFRRHYNSYDSRASSLGSSWRHNYDRSIEIIKPDFLVKISRADGSVYEFNKAFDGWRSLEDSNSVLTSDGNSFVYTNKGVVESYDASGQLQSITNQDNRTQTLSYNTDGSLSKVTDDTGKELTFNYSAGSLQSVVTPSGRTWTYNYDASNNLKTVTNPDDTVLTYLYEDAAFPTYLTGIIDERNIASEHYTYDAEGRAVNSHLGSKGSNVDGVSVSYGVGEWTTVTNSAGGYTTNRYIMDSGVPQITQTTGSGGCTSCGSGNEEGTKSYGSDHNIISEIKGGIETTYGDYDANGNYGFQVLAANTVDEKRIDYTYDLRFSSSVKTKTEPSVYLGQSKVTTTTYDNLGNVTQLSINGFTPTGTPISRNTDFTYAGPLNQLSNIDGPRTDVNDVTTIEYYPNDIAQGSNRARLKRVTTGDITTRDNIQYTSSGKIASEQRPNGVLHTYQYFIGNDRLQTFTKNGNSISTTTQWTYLATGEVETVISNASTPAATTITFGYDAARRLISIIDNNGNRILYTLDTEGNITNEEIYDSTSQLKHAVAQTFDLYNTLDTNSRANELVDYSFLPDGTLNTVIDGENVMTDYDYDALKRLTKVTQDLGGADPATENATSRYAYDVQNNLTSVTDPINGNTNFVYDDLGNLLQQTSPDSGTTILTYDAAGNVASRVDAKNQNFTYNYDVLNRRILLDAPGTTDDVSYIYDACPLGVGRLCSITHNGIVSSYAYNSIGDITSHQGVQYNYDYPGRVNTITYPSGNSVTYYYDRLGQVSQVDASVSGVVQTIASNISYESFGPITALTYGNGSQLAQSFDLAGRMTGQSIPAIFERNYTLYDGNGNLKSMDDLVSNTSDAFTFDSLNRITNAVGSYGTQSFGYDKNGNRTVFTDAAATTTSVYQPLSNRLTQVAANTITLDNNGNTINDGKHTYAFDSYNRLVNVDSNLASYQYNGLGQRIGKQAGGSSGLNYTVLAVEAQTEADSLNQQASVIQQQASDLLVQAVQFETDAALLTLQVQQYRTDADALQVQITDLSLQQTQELQLAAQHQTSANSYMALVVEPPAGFLQSLYNYIYNWITDYYQTQADTATDNANAFGLQVPILQAQIDPLNAQAIQLEQNATALLTQASALRSQATTLQAQGNNLIQQADVVQAKAVEYTLLAQNPSVVTVNNQYIYNLSGKLLVENSGGSTKNEYIYLNGQPLAVVRQGNVYYIHTDNLGTPRAVSDLNQTVLWRWNSDSFGSTPASEDVDGDGTNFVMNLRFPGQYYDMETGLHYNYFRDYDPSTGRYLQSDPIGLAGGLNTYGYVGGNPLKWMDPLGLYTDARWISEPSFGGVSKTKIRDMSFGEYWSIIPPGIGFGGEWFLFKGEINGVVECIDDKECGKRKTDTFNINLSLGKKVGIGWGITTAPLLQTGRSVAGAFSSVVDAVNAYNNEWSQLAIDMARNPMAWCVVSEAIGASSGSNVNLSADFK